jgi:NADPH-dependent 2,4-dienoyl-CoA reductase/sulfur reductase-like enzyme
MKVVIIGGVAAGMSAASKIHRLDAGIRVTVYEKGGFLSYGACGLPYYVGGFNDDYRKMIARSREAFETMGVKTFLRHEVRSVDPEKKQVVVKDLESGREFIDSYDKLMIATGAEAVIPPFSGRDLLGIHVLKTMEDGIFLKEFSKMQKVKNVVIVGGGYIGVECAEAFLHSGKNVRIIETASRVLAPFDGEIGALAQEELIHQGVMLHTGERVEAFLGDGLYVSHVKTDKAVYEADLVVVAVGIRPCTGFLKSTGIKMGKNGALVVDREMRTSIEDIYAAGDCILVYHEVLEEDCYQALGTVANKCGRIAGTNLAGGHEKFAGALGSAAIKVCDLELGRTGMGEEDAKRLKVDYKTLVINANDHPAYYPDPTPITIKLIYEKGTKRLLGVQTCGKKGAVLRADVFAVAIHARMTTSELGMTDLVYAPPFAGVWDAIQIACNAAK